MQQNIGTWWYNPPEDFIRRHKMTLCIATLCENRNAIVLAADKMIGQGFIEAELEIEKIVNIHPDWWALFAGTVHYVFDIVDEARRQLDPKTSYDVEHVTNVLTECYRNQRSRIVESTFLTPRGWTLEQFKATGLAQLGQFYFQALDTNVANHALDLQLLVAGFDSLGIAHLFTVYNPGIHNRHDIPGYHAIGNGWIGALYFMFYREMSIKMSIAEALYHVFEAKIFGYQAGGIGEETDLIILRHNEEAIRLQETKLPILYELWERFRPQSVTGLQRALGRYVRQKQARHGGATSSGTPQHVPET